MNPSANGTACQMVSIEIKEVTPREARKAKTEAECRGSLTTESEVFNKLHAERSTDYSHEESGQKHYEMPVLAAACGRDAALVATPTYLEGPHLEADYPGDYIGRTGCPCFFIYSPPIIIGMLQIILSSFTINKLKHVRAGAWWVGAVIMTCPYVSLHLQSNQRFYFDQRFYFSLLIAIGTAAVAFSGTLLDLKSSGQFSSLSACAGKGDIYPYKDSGKLSDYLVAKSCFNSTEFFESNGCYCVFESDPSTCTEYVRYSSTISSTDDAGIRTYHTCYDTVASFATMMEWSSILCGLVLLFALLQILYISLSQRKCRCGVRT